MKTLAAILVELGKPLVIDELEVPALAPGQALVEIARSGVCHTQLLECRGHRGADRFLPHCLGHEASGRVLDIGPGVTKVNVGDAVILSWIKGSGANVMSTVYRWQTGTVNAGAITTFSRHAVLSENRLTQMPAGLTLEQAALMGCAVATGAGAVINTARPAAGESLVVFGIGGVGACALSAAGLIGCSPVIAVDLAPARLELARRLGATHTLDASQGDVTAEIKRLCGGGADHAIEATGRPPVMEQALACVRAQGGCAVVVGNAHAGERVPLDPGQLNQGKRLLGTWGGDTQPDRDFPRFAKLVAAGLLRLDALESPLYGLGQVNDALADLEAARVARPMLDPSKE